VEGFANWKGIGGMSEDLRNDLRIGQTGPVSITSKEDALTEFQWAEVQYERAVLSLNVPLQYLGYNKAEGEPI
jgi:hypothetical protein